MNRGRAIAIVVIGLTLAVSGFGRAAAAPQVITGLSIVAGETLAESIIQVNLRLPAGDSQVSLLADDQPIVDRQGYHWDRVPVSPDTATTYRLEIPWLGASQPAGCRLPQRLTARIDGPVTDSLSIAVVQAEARREVADAAGDVYTFGSTQFDQSSAFLDTVAVTNVPWLDLTSAVLANRSGAVSVQLETAGSLPAASQALVDPVAGSIDARDVIKLVLLHDADCDPMTGDQSSRNSEFPRAGFDTAILASGVTTLTAAERQWSASVETWDAEAGAWAVVPQEGAATVTLTVDGHDAMFVLANGSPINPAFLGPAAWRFLAYHAVPEYRQPSRLDVMPDYDQPKIEGADMAGYVIAQVADQAEPATPLDNLPTLSRAWWWLGVPIGLLLILIAVRRRR